MKMTLRLTIPCTAFCAVMALGTAMPAQPAPAAPAANGGANAASPPASAAGQLPAPAGASVLVKVNFGDTKPGTPAPARLQIPAMNIDIATHDNGERALSGVPRGKLQLKVYVARADPCSLTVDIAGDKVTKVNLFVPKRGLDLNCERLPD